MAVAAAAADDDVVRSERRQLVLGRQLIKQSVEWCLSRYKMVPQILSRRFIGRIYGFSMQTYNNVIIAKINYTYSQILPQQVAFDNLI